MFILSRSLDPKLNQEAEPVTGTKNKGGALKAHTQLEVHLKAWASLYRHPVI